VLGQFIFGSILIASAMQDPCASFADVRFNSLVPATFAARPNRFLVWADVGPRRVAVASRDPGRLEGILVPGAPLLLAPAAGPGRRTSFTLVLARQGDTWVCLVPALASQIVHFAAARNGIPGWKGVEVVRREVRSGLSRLDFLLRHRGRLMLAEVKAAAHVRDRRALFPDCPSVRATRHLRELIAARRRGGEAALLFVVQREDADRLAPWRAVDPEFAQALRDARRAGVRVRAYTCRVTPDACTLARRIPVESA
jgi:sugar fermentation stimulation protein A